MSSFGINAGKLETRVHMVVADNTSNMKKALREGHFEAQDCLAHTSQLVVHDGVLHNVPLLILLQFVIALLVTLNILL